MLYLREGPREAHRSRAVFSWGGITLDCCHCGAGVLVQSLGSRPGECRQSREMVAEDLAEQNCNARKLPLSWEWKSTDQVCGVDLDFTKAPAIVEL